MPVRLIGQLNLLYSNLNPQLKILLPLWILFFGLIALGVHGSSLPCAAEWWDPGAPYSGYLFNSLAKSAPASVGNYDSTLKDLAMAQPRDVRADEWLVQTPSALSQFSHNPRFPVINDGVGDGQNMLVGYLNPVWHVTTIARPATWGYFLLGRQRGLAWVWWFQVFGCFTALFLLLDVVLKGNRLLAAFGAFWFCGSAYVVCWSLWPAYHVFFPALACLSAYHMLHSDRAVIRIVNGLLLGLSLAGFAMLLYPAWEVPLTYLFAVVFVALFFRDKLYTSLRTVSVSHLMAIVIAVLTAAGLGLAFWTACKPALLAMSNTVFPGRRASLGGDFSLASLFKGMYNSVTSYSSMPGEANRSEYASFFHLYPAIFVALLLSRRLARGVGVVSWAIAGFLGLVLVYQFVGFWPRVAKYSLFGFTTSYRVDIAVGLASIILSVSILAFASQRDRESGRERVVPTIASLVLSVLIVIGGLQGAYLHNGFPPIGAIITIATLAGLTSYCLLRGRQSPFYYLIGTALVATGAFFNPLSTNIDFLYRSEVARKIQSLDAQSAQAPLWICYGPDYPGTLVTLLGGRTISGILWPPQTEMWRRFDPQGQYEWFYNRFAHVHLKYESDPRSVTFEVPTVDTLIVSIAPDNSTLKAAGARYILAGYWAQKEIDGSKFPLIFQSSDGNFSIFQVQ